MWEKEVKNIYIGGMPTSWLLGYRPLQSDLKDYSWNWKDGSWFSGTGTFSTNAGKTGARVTQNSSQRTSQHVVTSLTYFNTPITVCWWICYNSAVNSPSNRPRTWLMTTSSGSGQTSVTLWTRPADNFYAVAAVSDSIRIASSVPSINTWYFWAATRSWETIKTYLNWVLADTGTATSSLTGWVRRLGCAMIDSWQTLHAGTDGWVRYCFVYNRALSDSEIMEIYNLTK